MALHNAQALAQAAQQQADGSFQTAATLQSFEQVPVDLSPETIEAIAQRVAELLKDHLPARTTKAKPAANES